MEREVIVPVLFPHEVPLCLLCPGLTHIKSNRNTAKTRIFLKLCYSGSKTLHLRQGRIANNAHSAHCKRTVFESINLLKMCVSVVTCYSVGNKRSLNHLPRLQGECLYSLSFWYHRTACKTTPQ